MIQSHDFASTYVGTPFYMSPEICAAEKYTLKSDIWSLGCIIYELCAREPPFNAKSHFQLIQKIKEGKVAPLPDIYSPELMGTIKDCLRVNPDRRPDTAQLLNLPVVRLMRKEREVVELNKLLKAKEGSLKLKEQEIQRKMESFEAEKTYTRQEMDNALRREWEVKARLEIDRHIQMEVERLRKRYEDEVQARVQEELQKRAAAAPAAVPTPVPTPTPTGVPSTTTSSSLQPGPAPETDLSSSTGRSDYPYSSLGHTSAEGDISSATDLTELSDHSPEAPAMDSNLKKVTRTPLGRAQTMFVGNPAGTPMDVEMVSPSPMAIASLSLSPRRNEATKPPTANPANIFTANAAATGAAADALWKVPREPICIDSDDDDLIPSPTRNIKSRLNPFNPRNRPMLSSQKTAPPPRLKSKLSGTALNTNKSLPIVSATGTDAGRGGALGQQHHQQQQQPERCPSPIRRVSKIPSATNLQAAAHNGSDGVGSNLSRKVSNPKKDQEPLGKAVAKNNIRGRTLVELQQARAGGRPLSALPGVENTSPKRNTFKDRLAGRRSSAESPAPVWDPEKDEMPSPFLVRKRQPLLRA